MRVEITPRNRNESRALFSEAVNAWWSVDHELYTVLLSRRPRTIVSFPVSYIKEIEEYGEGEKLIEIVDQEFE